jgi:4-alpha-glucanotransferase
VAYTGTHDNNTLLGYIWEADEATRRRTLRYCGFTAEDWNTPASYEAVIRTLLRSTADLAILPIQDVLGFGADCRMNIPGQPEGNWRYRVTSEQIATIDREKYRSMNALYGR